MVPRFRCGLYFMEWLNGPFHGSRDMSLRTVKLSDAIGLGMTIGVGFVIVPAFIEGRALKNVFQIRPL